MSASLPISTLRVENWPSKPLSAAIFILAALSVFAAARGKTSHHKLLHYPGSNGELLTLRVEIADEADERIKGLSGRESLGKDEGLLMVFPTPGYHGIWMKKMRFAIDVIWLDESGCVVNTAAGIRPDSYPKTFRPFVPAKYILELKSDPKRLASIRENPCVLPVRKAVDDKN